MPVTESSDMQVSPAVDMLGRWVNRHRQFCVRIGNIESWILSTDLADIPIRAPVYITGLARSGSTILLEMLASHPHTATHRYQDFPFIFMPYWWNRTLALTPFKSTARRERAHKDGIYINPQSPEAMEEMLWMAFFPDLHASGRSQLLDESTKQAAFEAFYRSHIKKLLLVRRKQRYVAKNNYNVSRMAYIRTLFPDARFIIPVRNPVTHITSLLRQQKHFSAAGHNDPRVVTHMSIAGHCEFGLGRTAIDIGDHQRVRDIEQAWRQGNEIAGWALYWDMIYAFIHQQLEAHPELNHNTLIIPFETLYEQPDETIKNLLRHAALADDHLLSETWAPALRKPDYYESTLTPDEIALIHSITEKTAAAYGYR